MKRENLKLMVVPILLFIGMSIGYLSYYIFENDNQKQKCEPIQVHPGDTIVFKYPNIPKNLRYKDANIMFYQPHTDSVVITYNSNCK